MPVFAASCEMLICGVCGLNAWITSSPRASEVMKLGSPAKTSRVEACVDLAFADAAAAPAGAVRAYAGLADRALLAAAGLAKCEADVGRRDGLLIEVPSRSPAMFTRRIAGCAALNRELEANGQGKSEVR